MDRNLKNFEFDEQITLSLEQAYVMSWKQPVKCDYENVECFSV